PSRRRHPPLPDRGALPAPSRSQEPEGVFLSVLGFYSRSMSGPSANLSRRGLARLLALSPFALSANRVAPQEAWSMATEYPPSTMSGEGIPFFTSELAKQSAGRLAILAAYDGPRGLKSADIVAAIRDGQLAAGDSLGGALGRIDPLFLLSSLPF